MPEDTAPALEVPSPKHRWLYIVIAAVGLIGAGIWYLTTRVSAAPAPQGVEPQVRATLHLETFVLNLADPDQRAYLRVGIDLGLRQETGKSEVVPTAQIRDTILGVLSLARGEELLTAQGKAKLKDDLLRALQKRMPELGVEEVYFTEFLIQR